MSNIEKGGIPWETIFDESHKGRSQREVSGEVNGRSGLRLTYSITRRRKKGRLEVSDKANPNFYLIAWTSLINSGDFCLSLRTKGFKGDPNKRHPDMRAREFTGIALAFFKEKRGIMPTHFVGQWYPDSDN